MQVAGFTKYWGGEVYHDVDKTIYKALGGGQLRTKSELAVLNPFGQTLPRVLSAQKNVKDYSLVPEGGFIMGGFLLVKPGDNGVAYMHVERTLGEYPEVRELIAASKAAVCGACGECKETPAASKAEVVAAAAEAGDKDLIPASKAVAEVTAPAAACDDSRV